MVSAFAAGMGVVLGQRATDEKSNEITAIPELLATLALEGTIVTIDAMGTQTEIARTIQQRGADYTLRGHNLRFWTSLAGCDARRPECGLVILKQATGNTAAHPPDAEQKCKL
jgi:predicted kinase